MVHALAYVIASWCAPGLESIRKIKKRKICLKERRESYVTIDLHFMVNAVSLDEPKRSVRVVLGRAERASGSRDFFSLSRSLTQTTATRVRKSERELSLYASLNP